MEKTNIILTSTEIYIKNYINIDNITYTLNYYSYLNHIVHSFIKSVVFLHTCSGLQKRPHVKSKIQDPN